MASSHKKRASATTAILEKDKAKFVPKGSFNEIEYDKKQPCKKDDKKAIDIEKVVDSEPKSCDKKSKSPETKKIHSSFKIEQFLDGLNIHKIKKHVFIHFNNTHKTLEVGKKHRNNNGAKKGYNSFQNDYKRYIFDIKKYLRRKFEDFVADVYRVFIGLMHIKDSPNYHEFVLKAKIFGALLGMICIIFVVNNLPTGYKKAYAVVLDNKVVGYLKDQSEAKNLMTEIAKEIEKKHQTDDFKLQNQIQLKSIEPGEYRETNMDDLKNNIIEKGKVLVKRYALFVNSKPYFVFQDKSTPKKILEELKQIYYKGNSSKASFNEKIEIKAVYVSPRMKLAADQDALKKIMFGKDKVLEYTIKEGDTLWDLSVKYNISVDDIFASNPGLSEKIMPGQKIRLTKATPLINVVLTKEVEYEDVLPKQVKVLKSANYYTTQTIVKQEGKDGRAKIKAKIVYMNGLEYDRQIISQKIIQKPVERVVVVGTKKPPAYFATGRFSYPVWGTLTSRYGYRGREFHEGIDIAVPWGTSIYAADGGEVEFAGWSGGYGKLIIINHKNGYQTYYGHLSRMLVYPGQKVVKGQIIAKSGSTGRSTGPHLHFEVRKNGVAQNPLRYLR